VATTLHFAGQFEMPLAVQTLAAFRAWALSDDFPESGRIDYIAGRIDIDMSPEKFISHGRLKTAMIRSLEEWVDEQSLGYLVADSTRVSSVSGQVSSEPDLVFVAYDSLTSGKVKLTPSKRDPEDFVEVEGGPDLIVEIVSDRSVKKDTQDLPKAYFAAGVDEYWLADARGEEIVFQMHRRGDDGFEPIEADAEGFQQSMVFQCGYRLSRTRDQRGYWRFRLERRD